jgi:hypothetical protein
VKWFFCPSAEIVEEFRRRFDAGDEEMVAGAGAGDVEEVAFGVVDLLEVGIVRDRLDPLPGAE